MYETYINKLWTILYDVYETEQYCVTTLLQFLLPVALYDKVKVINGKKNEIVSIAKHDFRSCHFLAITHNPPV